MSVSFEFVREGGGGRGEVGFSEVLDTLIRVTLGYLNFIS